MTTTATRAEVVDGLRQLADFLESHDDVPLPRVWASVYLYGNDAKAKLAEAAGAIGSSTKGADRSYFGLVKMFGPVEYEVKAWREDVCERVVVGTRTQTISVPPEGVELIEKTISEDIVEWVCPPSILALASDAEAVA